MVNKTVEFVQNPWYNLFIGNILSQEIILMKKTGIISLAAAALFCTYFGFSSHVKAQEKIEELYQDKHQWAKMCLVNIAKSGYFSSDRTIGEYAEDIWNAEPLKF